MTKKSTQNLFVGFWCLCILTFVTSCGGAHEFRSQPQILPSSNWHMRGGVAYYDNLGIQAIPFNYQQRGKSPLSIRLIFYPPKNQIISIEPSTFNLSVAHTFPKISPKVFECAQRPPHGYYVKTEDQTIDQLVITENNRCLFLEFDVPAPPIEVDFFLTLRGILINGRAAPILEILFRKGEMRTGYGSFI